MFPSSSTSSVSLVTATVLTVALPETDELPTEVAVIVDVLLSPSFALPGTATWTQTWSCHPG